MQKYGAQTAGAEVDRWGVEHPVEGYIEVVESSREMAIKTACENWGISWGLNAGDCNAMKRGKPEKKRCRICGTEKYVSEKGVCNSCRADMIEQQRSIKMRRENARRGLA